jgi:hypothetical protein
MTCLPAIDTTGLCKDDINSLAEQTRKDMIAEFHRSSAEVLMEVNRFKPEPEGDNNCMKSEVNKGNKIKES